MVSLVPSFLICSWQQVLRNAKVLLIELLRLSRWNAGGGLKSPLPAFWWPKYTYRGIQTFCSTGGSSGNIFCFLAAAPHATVHVNLEGSPSAPEPVADGLLGKAKTAEIQMSTSCEHLRRPLDATHRRDRCSPCLC